MIIKGKFMWVREKEGVLLMKVKRSMNRLYKLIIYSGDAKCLLTRCEDDNWLWHSHLGHETYVHDQHGTGNAYH